LKKIVLLMIIITALAGCSFLSKIKPMRTVSKNSESIAKDTLNSDNNPLEKQLKLSYEKIDSLYENIDNLNYTVDSLYQALEIANNRISINKNFIIPDSILFAGKVFNLRNERISSKFKKISTIIAYFFRTS